EAQAIARLRHANIVQIYEIGESEEGLYLSLEYVEGGSLAGRLNGTPQPPAQAAELVETLARAIDCAHRQGIIHRDLKPANVLMASPAARGDQSPVTSHHSPLTTHQLKITDFGLAKVAGGADLTQSGAFVGTPSYAAPEQ